MIVNNVLSFAPIGIAVIADQASLFILKDFHLYVVVVKFNLF